MDSTIYQCPECNYNASNLVELNAHLSEKHDAIASKKAQTTNEKNNDDNHHHSSNNGYDYDDEPYDVDEEGHEEIGEDEEDMNQFNEYYDDMAADDNKPAIAHSIQHTNGMESRTNGIKTRQNEAIPNSDNHYERQYVCKMCDYFTNNPRAILYHRKEVHGEKITVYECSFCQYASQYTGKVERHTMLRHKLDANKKQPNANNESESNLDEHETSRNNNAGRVESSLKNSKESTDQSPLNNSQNSSSNNNNNHSNLRPRPARTSMGSKADFQPAPGTQIITSAASYSTSPFGFTTFKCNKCPCTYKRASDLTKHLKTKHNIIANNSRNFIMQQPHQIISGAASTSSGQTMSGTNDDDCDDMFGDDENYDNENNENIENASSVNSPAKAVGFTNNSTNNNEPNGHSNKQANEQKQKSDKSTTNTSNSYPCPYCAYCSEGDDAEYIAHIKDHLCGKAFRCVLCNSVYKYRGDCVVHLKRKHQKADAIAQNYVERFNLDEIDISIIYSILKPNQTEEMDNEDKLFGCSYCEYKANYKGDVFKHQTRRHPGVAKSVLQFNSGADGALEVSTNMNYGYYSSSENNSVNNSFNNATNGNANGTANGDDKQNHVAHTNDDEENYDDEEDMFNDDHNKKPNNNHNNHFSLKVKLNGNARALNGNNNHAHRMNEEEDDEFFDEEENDDYYDLENDGEPIEERNYDENDFNEYGNYDDEINEENQMDAEQNYDDYDDEDDQYDDRNFQHASGANHQNMRLNNNNMPGLNNHHANGNRPLSKHQCTFCSFVAKNSAKLQLHLATHYNLKKYMCPVCKRRANFKWDIQKHLRKLHNDYVSEVICLSEEEARRSIDSYIKPNGQLNGSMHNQDGSMVRNGGDDDEMSVPTRNSMRERKFKCSLCSRLSKWQWDIKKHMRTVHKGLVGTVVVINDTDKSENDMQENRENIQVYNAMSNSNGPSFNKNSQPNITTIGQMSKSLNESLNRSSIGTYTNANIVGSVGADATGNKKFKCKSCPYRTNWKADLFRHLRKRHFVPNPGLENVIILSVDEAANTIADYEAKHGINVRKRTFVEQDDTSYLNESSMNNQNQNGHSSNNNHDFAEHNEITKRFKGENADFDDQPYSNNNNQNNEDGDDYYNEQQDQDDYDEDYSQSNEMANSQDEDTNANDNENEPKTVADHPVCIARLNIKPFQCAKCGYRSDRKADTLRHLRNKHSTTELRFLRILSIPEASRTVEEYDRMRLYKRGSLNGSSANVNENSNNSHSNGHVNNGSNSPAKPMNSINTNTSVNGFKPIAPLVKNNSDEASVNENERDDANLNDNQDANENATDYYRCPFCTFKHLNKMTMRRHLLIHYRNIEMNPGINQQQQNQHQQQQQQQQQHMEYFSCNACSFKAKWHYTVKMHILKCHYKQPNVGIIKLRKAFPNDEPTVCIMNANGNGNGYVHHNGTNGYTNDNGRLNNNHYNDSNSTMDNDDPYNDQCNENYNDEYNNMYDDNDNGEYNGDEMNNYNEYNEEDEEYEQPEASYPMVNQSNASNINSSSSTPGPVRTHKNINNNVSLSTEHLGVDESGKSIEKIKLMDYSGNPFEAKFLVECGSSVNSPSPSIDPVTGQIVNRKKTYYCEKCPYKTYNYCNLKQHLLQHLYRAGLYKCRYCDYYVSMIRLLKQHEVLHPDYEKRDTYFTC